MELYSQQSYKPKQNARLNLCGRTHYVDQDTLRYHKARIVSAGDTCASLLFYIVESVALDYQNKKRGFRGVVFNVYGSVIYRPSLDQCYRTSHQARTAMYSFINGLDVIAATREAIADELASATRDAKQAREELAAIESKFQFKAA